MNITQPSFYVNDLEIPQAIAQPSIGSNTPTNASRLVDCITYVERSVLLNCLGLVKYNEFQAALPITEESDPEWKDLVNGKEYDGKIWEGLSSPKSLLCYIVRYTFLDGNSTFWSTMGIMKPESENATNFTPAFELATTYQKFIKKYQGGCLSEPHRYFGLDYSYTDFYGETDEIEVSLYQYLRDNVDLYSWDISKFKHYNNDLNSFGL